MKRMIFSKHTLQYFSFIMLLIFSCRPGLSFGQSDTTRGKEGTSISPSVDFISIQKSDNTIALKATYKAKINGTVTKLPGLHITFFVKKDSTEKQIGETVTDISGMALFNCKADAIQPGKEEKLRFKASFAGNKMIAASEDELAVKRASLVITPVKKDSVLSVQLKLADLTTGAETPIPGTGLNVYVKRLFNPLKLGDGKTDENGTASVEIPANLPGDAKGNITLLARLEDNEEYGNLEASVIQSWGKPVSDEVKELPRALWSAHPPIWMLVTFVVLMTAVWGHYFVIVYELFRLRKEQPKETVT
jgi:hypothetical protein